MSASRCYVNSFGRGGYPNGGNGRAAREFKGFPRRSQGFHPRFWCEQAQRGTAIACRVLSKLKKRTQPAAKRIRNGRV
jgi:hypothetical protein